MQNNIRNFAIIAHVDHGKSTLADRLLEITGTISKQNLKEQFLDSSAISREHGITIKLAPVRMDYELDNTNYILNLIDTPGHVDFSYEVIRTLYACEGAVLLVDATKGIQAQTVANYNFAKKIGLVVIPVINKIDLPTANVELVEKDLIGSFGFLKEEIIYISAKTGEGVGDLIKIIIERVPAPSGSVSAPTQALIFDSIYDQHRGIVIFVRIKNGLIRKGEKIIFASDKTSALVMESGYMKPTFFNAKELVNGEVGFLITNIKDITQAKVGDTIIKSGENATPLVGYLQQKPFVYFNIYPTSTSEFQNLRKAVFKLKLNDASLTIEPEQSSIFGPGFKCGFLGLLHAQIFIEKVEKEEGVDVFAAPPSIEYIVDGKSITSPKDFNNENREVLEPYVSGEIYTPTEHIGSLLEIIHAKRGENADIIYFGVQAKITFSMPLASVIYDFYDKIKSASSGYASFDYEISDFRKSDLLRVDISVNDQVIPELSFAIHKSEVETFSRKLVKVLAEAIPKHQFVISVRAAVGSKIIASEKIASLSKNVLSKMSGGDYSRKSKLLDKQKEGKKKMKQIGRVNVPKEAFLSVLKV